MNQTELDELDYFTGGGMADPTPEELAENEESPEYGEYHGCVRLDGYPYHYTIHKVTYYGQVDFWHEVHVPGIEVEGYRDKAYWYGRNPALWDIIRSVAEDNVRYSIDPNHTNQYETMVRLHQCRLMMQADPNSTETFERAPWWIETFKALNLPPDSEVFRQCAEVNKWSEVLGVLEPRRIEFEVLLVFEEAWTQTGRHER